MTNVELALLGIPVDMALLGQRLPAYLGTLVFVVFLGGTALAISPARWR